MLKKLVITVLSFVSICSFNAQAELYYNPCWMQDQMLSKISHATSMQEVNEFMEALQTKYGPECAAHQQEINARFAQYTAERAAKAEVSEGLSSGYKDAFLIAGLAALIIIPLIYEKFFATAEVQAENNTDRNTQETDLAPLPQ